MAKNVEIKLKYSEARIRALRSVFAKRNTTLEAEMLDALAQLYKKNVKPDVREFIEEIEESESQILKKTKSASVVASDKSNV